MSVFFCCILLNIKCIDTKKRKEGIGEKFNLVNKKRTTKNEKKKKEEENERRRRRRRRRRKKRILLGRTKRLKERMRIRIGLFIY